MEKEESTVSADEAYAYWVLLAQNHPYILISHPSHLLKDS
jgi:hypothetical protein